MLNKNIFTYSQHKKWFFNNIYDDEKYFFALYWKTKIVGFGNITSINKKTNTAEWGLYKSPYKNININSGIILYLTCLFMAFEVMKLKELKGNFLKKNLTIYKLHNFFGVNIQNPKKKIDSLPIIISTKINKIIWKKIKFKYWDRYPGNLNKNIKKI